MNTLARVLGGDAFNLAIEALASPVAVLDVRGSIVHWNAAWGAVAPCALAGSQGRALAEQAASPRDASEVERAIRACDRSSEPVRATWAQRDARGVRRLLACVLARRDDGLEGRRIVVSGTDVTDLEEERDTAVATVRALVRDAPVGILVSDTSGRYIDVNDEMCRLVGRARASLLGTTVLDLIAPDEVARWHAARDAFVADQVHFGEWKLRHTDGHDVHVEISARVTPDGSWQAFVHDVGVRRAEGEERERLLRQAQAERRWLDEVLEAVPVGIVIVDQHGRVRANRYAQRFVGRLDPDGGRQQWASRVFRLDGTPIPWDELISTRVLERGESVAGAELLLESPDGVRWPVLVSAGPVRDEEGRLVGGLGVLQDISESIRAAAAVRQNERLLDAIFELLPVGVWIADHTGHIVRTNPAGLRMWSGVRYVGPEEFGVYRAWWADSGAPVASHDWALARAMQGGETSTGELLRIQCFDGTFKTVINAAMPIVDEHGERVGGIVVNEDVTPLRDTELALRAALLARDELLAAIAHDLRSPLQTILIQLGLLDDSVARGGQEGHAIALMERQCERIDRLVQELLDSARLDTTGGTPERTALDAESLVCDAVEARQAGATLTGLALRVDVPASLPAIHGARDPLLRVFDNLIGNALKFTPRGGTVTVRATPADHAVVFSVGDTGAGIAPEHLGRVFERFWQVEPGDRRGAGLGLAIVKAIVQAHGGSIGVDSRLGQGTTFWFSIPTSPPVAEG